MRFELVALNAKFIHSNPAIHSLRSYAIHKHPEFEENILLSEYTINNREEEILSGLYRSHADAIGFSVYIWNWKMLKSMLPDLHRILPDTQIWLGGPEVSFDAPEILQEFPFLTGIMVGEGEVTFTEVLEHYMESRCAVDKGEVAESTRVTPDFHDIPGLVLQDGYTAMRELTDLSDIPFLYEELDKFKNRILYYESQRGCPYRCSYCLSSIDKKTRFRSLELVHRELAFFLENRVEQVKFIDRTFNCKEEHAMSIWQYIYDHDNGVTNFHFEVAAEVLTEAELSLLAKMRPGLVQLEIGVQTTNPDTLRAIHRGMNLEHLRGIVDRLRSSHNIHVHLDLIAGLPEEDYASFAHSFDDVYAMEPEQLQLGFLKVLKGSEMHDRAEEYGLIYHENPPYEVIRTKWLSFDEVIDLKEVEEMVELYYNSNQYRHILPILVEETGSPFAFFRSLADYYKEQGYSVNTPSRTAKYEILLAYAVSRHPERKELYLELMMFDLYLRENLKSRPDFAPDQSEYYEWISEFYRRESEERVYLPGYEEYNSRQLQKMTHMECFRYPVWKAAWRSETDGSGAGKSESGDSYAELVACRLETPARVLFDYKSRDPLTQDARYEVIE